MTLEQRKIVNRCANMIKAAFPAVAGKVVFKLTSNEKKIHWEYVHYGVSSSEHIEADSE